MNDETTRAATPLQAGPGFARRFPIRSLPPQMRDYAADIAERKMVPVDLPAMFMLGIASGVVGPRFMVRRDHDWIEPTNSYAIVGMRSGTAKTPVVRELLQGLGKARKVLAEAHEREVALRQSDLDKQIEDCLSRAAAVTTSLEEKTGLRARAKELQAQAEQLAQKPPKPPLLVVDGDTTPEALAERMAANGGYASVVDDEGPLIRNLGGQYAGKTANLAVLLKAYDGQPYYPSRITREAATMDRATLSITISPQPALVAEMLRNMMMDETGLINRFFVAMPGDLLGKRVGRASTFIDDVAERENQALRLWWSDTLADLAAYEPLTGDQQADALKVLDLTRGAWKLHYDYQEEFEPRLDKDSDGDLWAAVGWASKHCGRILRLAALLHLLSGATADDRIEESTMRCAIAIGEWSLEHYLRLGRVVGLSESADRIREFVLGQPMPWASRTQINAEVFRRNAPSKQLDAWLRELVESGEFELRKTSAGPGRPTWFLCKVGARLEVARDAA